MATKKQLAKEISELKGIEIDPNQYYKDELEVMLKKEKEDQLEEYEDDYDDIDETVSNEVVNEIIDEIHKPKEKEITGVDYADMFALGQRAIFFIRNKYGLEKRTIQEWKDTFEEDGLI